MFRFRLGLARHHQFPPVGQRHMHIEHQNVRKGFQYGSGRQPRRVGWQPIVFGKRNAA